MFRFIYEGVRQGNFVHCPLLRILACLWRAASRLRHWMYDRHYLQVQSVDAVVVSVGNITAGGTGKTPLVLLLAQSLQIKPVAIISRGYKSSRSGLPLGDELTMLSRHLSQCLFYASPDRIETAKRATSSGARLIILDDGFQHRRLHRDFDLVIVDGANPFGYGAFLPCGLLRDCPDRLRKADAIFIHGPCSPADEAAIQYYTETPVIRTRLVLHRILDLNGCEVPSLAGRMVAVFCAIGQPSRFIETVRYTGATVVSSEWLPDHDRFFQRELEGLFYKTGVEALVCTEKDAVKIDFNPLFPIYYLEMRMEVISGFEAWQTLIDKIQGSVERYLT
jgi:tetraacyldisaccharide 4'-kinase